MITNFADVAAKRNQTVPILKSLYDNFKAIFLRNFDIKMSMLFIGHLESNRTRKEMGLYVFQGQPSSFFFPYKFYADSANRETLVPLENFIKIVSHFACGQLHSTITIITTSIVNE